MIDGKRHPNLSKNKNRKKPKNISFITAFKSKQTNDEKKQSGFTNLYNVNDSSIFAK